jgi:hypothetical protein
MRIVENREYPESTLGDQVENVKLTKTRVGENSGNK